LTTKTATSKMSHFEFTRRFTPTHIAETLCQDPPFQLT